jgi:hypothetical protein
VYSQNGTCNIVRKFNDCSTFVDERLMMTVIGPANFKGFRRRFRIVPTALSVVAALEDDYHCMLVTLHHDGTIILSVDAQSSRYPWTTCSGAVEVIRSTFTGVALAQAARRGDKLANCTHLYDLALVAAAHAHSKAACVYDVFVTDAIDDVVTSEIYRNDELMLHWEIQNGTLMTPDDIAGTELHLLKHWIAAQAPHIQEAARILQWASFVAYGRALPIDQQSTATDMEPHCYTFQPDRAKLATRFGRIFDFSTDVIQPLDHLSGDIFQTRPVDPDQVWPVSE